MDMERLGAQSLNSLERFVTRLASHLGQPAKKRAKDEEFWWVYRKENLPVLLVAKAVRATSALNAAWILASKGLGTECAVLLRAATDFANEIVAMSVSGVTGELNKAQQEFMSQFFDKQPDSIDEFRAMEREPFVARRKLYAAYQSFAEQNSQGDEPIRDVSSFIDYKLDKYVHGSYRSAMELYNGQTRLFQMFGIEEKRPEAQRIVLLKIVQMLNALSFVAWLFGDRAVRAEIIQARKVLDDALSD